MVELTAPVLHEHRQDNSSRKSACAFAIAFLEQFYIYI